MESQSIATGGRAVALPRPRAGRAGLGWAAVGVLAFSLTLPATAVALRSLDAYIVGAGRSVAAAVIAGACLLAVRAPLPPRAAWPGLAAVAGGCGIGFGLLSALALRQTSSTHAAIVVGLLPGATAVVAVVRAGERPAWPFWAASAAATATVVGYAATLGGGRLAGADLLLLGALVVGAVGYAEGGRLAREIPGWQVIAWGVLLALPVSLPVTVAAVAASGPVHLTAAALGGLAYVSAVSMFLGFAAWYRGLGRAGVARASQLQLAQPLLTVGWSAALLGERVGPGALAVAAVVIACVLVTQRARIVAVAGAGDGLGPASGAPGAAGPQTPVAESGGPVAGGRTLGAESGGPVAGGWTLGAESGGPVAGPQTPVAASGGPVAGGSLGATARTRVHRHRERAGTERSELHGVLDAGLVAHVAFVVDGRPVVLPMGYARDGERLLLHGSSRNRMLRALADGAPACVTVTVVDGLVLAATAFTHSMNYRSAVIYGRGEEVCEPPAKAAALARFVDFVVPGRSAQLRPSTAKELAATLVVGIPLEEASVKARAGGPKAGAAGDGAPWTGVVPLRLVRGDPEPSG